MKRFLTALVLTGVLFAPLGCPTSATSTTPPTALAPGYFNKDDQNLGESLAAVNAFVQSEKTNYASLAPAQQQIEKPYLNTLIDAINVANAVYKGYHNNTTNFQQAQLAYNNAANAQQALIANKGVK